MCIRGLRCTNTIVSELKVFVHGLSRNLECSSPERLLCTQGSACGRYPRLAYFPTLTLEREKKKEVRGGEWQRASSFTSTPIFCSSLDLIEGEINPFSLQPGSTSFILGISSLVSVRRLSEKELRRKVGLSLRSETPEKGVYGHHQTLTNNNIHNDQLYHYIRLFLKTSSFSFLLSPLPHLLWRSLLSRHLAEELGPRVWGEATPKQTERTFPRTVRLPLFSQADKTLPHPHTTTVSTTQQAKSRRRRRKQKEVCDAEPCRVSRSP